MDKAALLRLVAQARHRAESGDHDIAAQQEIISALERKGLPTEKARTILDKLIAAQASEMVEMERLLDELDQG
jgi:hypothetical protein